MAEEGSIEFLPGFVWAMPRAFAPAVSAYRFEQGDVLYRSRAGYAPLAGRLPHGLTAIQLRQPPRSARATPSEFEGDRKLANWQSEVEIDVVDLEAGASDTIVTTQGRLFMALWRDDTRALRGDGDDPPLPRSARDLAQALRDDALAIEPPKGIRRGCRFLFVVDLSSDASRAKADTIGDALHALGRVAVRDRDPIEVGAERPERFHPTLVVRELVLREAEEAAVEAALRRALYGGSGEAERFSVARHGVLEPLGRSGAA